MNFACPTLVQSILEGTDITGIDSRPLLPDTSATRWRFLVILLLLATDIVRLIVQAFVHGYTVG